MRFVWFAETTGDKESLGWRTDASFVLVALNAGGKPEYLGIANATYLRTGGADVFRVSDRIDFAEPGPGEWNSNSFEPPA